MNVFQKAFKQIRQQQQLLAFLIFTLVAVLFWIGFGLASSQSQTGVDRELLKMAQPLTPYLDVAVVEKIENKNVYSSYELSDFPIYRLAENSQTRQTTTSTTPDNNDSLTSTSSATVNQNNSATPSSKLATSSAETN